MPRREEPADPAPGGRVRILRRELEDFCSAIFCALGIPPREAEDSAKILVAADARGIPSHGVAHLSRYTRGIEAGLIRGGISPVVLRETAVSRVLDAGGAMGMSLSRAAMDWVIGAAEKHGVGLCSIRNSNHFGIAGYYTEMAARAGMIGMAFSNTAALGVPTNARNAFFGTNPIAFAAPGEGGDMFSLDMATTTVTRGRIEIAEREGRAIPPGWAVGVNGKATTDPARLLEDMLYLRGGGLLPLGGEGTATGGYKGYGLAVMVDILCALTSGGTFGADVRDSETTSARVCHFFLALKLDMFRDPAEFKRDLSKMLRDLSSLSPAEGAERVYYAGLKSRENEEECGRLGVPVAGGVWAGLGEIARRLGVAVPPVVQR
ncbi:MAG: Ldh family oxidoreductase [Spirochaetaceae bacterium]|jgi:LDH2 family malate/lactate/ureidoglycolate dehydrogenase|nr:Ldh family oxidoreductase [Spirochaetaceae bacterium]